MSIPNFDTSGRPVAGLEVVAHEVAGHAEVAADRLADAQPVQRPRQRIGDVVGDRAVVLVARVQRRDVVVAALEDRPGEQLDPLGPDAPQVRVDDDERLDLQRRRDLEDGPQRRALAADAVDLRVRERDPRELVGRAGRAGFARRSPAARSRRRRAGCRPASPRPSSRRPAAGRGSTGRGRPVPRARHSRSSWRS